MLDVDTAVSLGIHTKSTYTALTGIQPSIQRTKTTNPNNNGEYGSSHRPKQFDAIVQHDGIRARHDVLRENKKI